MPRLITPMKPDVQARPGRPALANGQTSSYNRGKLGDTILHEVLAMRTFLLCTCLVGLTVTLVVGDGSIALPQALAATGHSPLSEYGVRAVRQPLLESCPAGCRSGL